MEQRTGQRIHYNFVKPHQALEGRTPAEASGIKIEEQMVSILEKCKRDLRLESPRRW